MNRYIRINKLYVYGAPVYVYWSVLLVAAVIVVLGLKQPIHAAIATVSYFGIIFGHEFGHALFAKRLGYKVLSLRIGFFHGLCEYEAPNSERDAVIVAWGGVLTQLAIAIPVMMLAQVPMIQEVIYFGPIIVFLGYINALVALANLAPSPFLDGHLAWRAFPMLASRLKPRVRKKRKKLKVIK